MKRHPAAKLPRDFYTQPVVSVARESIGKILVHRTAEGETAGRIVEAEAYRGPLDLASHSSKGLTRRTAAMFGPPGHAYVYLLYGVSWAMNLVVAPAGTPHAVLIRALEPIRGIELMARRRRRAADARELTNGPGKLAQALAITARAVRQRFVRRRAFSGRVRSPPRTSRTLTANQRRIVRLVGGKSVAIL